MTPHIHLTAYLNGNGQRAFFTIKSVIKDDKCPKKMECMDLFAK